MRPARKTVLRTLLLILIVFLIINAGWYVWRSVKYKAYIQGMEKNYFSTWLVPRYFFTDADGYDYSVKYPDYLSFTGNLSVGLPAAYDNPFTDFMIIWPKLSGDYEYGVSLTADGENYQIYINADGSPVDPAYSEITSRCQETIDALLGRAKGMWDLD
ncbi:MAG: hypothetical protein K5637_04145 [Lachnospiraceae bacterium]|nr:hypothetical protein [Lachnospiraceae bacterium]